MAKSYVTQFTEYVSKQQDSLREKLKAKGLSPNPNATLGNLVSDLDNLQESFGTEKYERDPNFPDIDTMFDNDLLRAVNGGQYLYCAYVIQLLDSNNNAGYYHSGGYALPFEKVIYSDDAEYDNITASFVHQVQENGIYVGEDGFNYCLVKMYSNTKPSNGGNYLPYGVEELIFDYGTSFGNSSSYSDPVSFQTVTNYNVPTRGFRYIRFPCSTNSESAPFTTYLFTITNGANTGPKYFLNRLKCARVDGPHTIRTIAGPFLLEKLIFNGSLVGSPLSVTLGQSVNMTSHNPVLDYFKVPYGSTEFNSYSRVKSLYISDTVTIFKLYGSSSSNLCFVSDNIEELHLGNGLTSWQTNAVFNYWYNLRNLTVSPGAFGLNETAITVDLSTAVSLTKESVLNIFNNVADRTGMTANILKLSAFSKSLVTDEEKAILTNKNWTLS